MSTRTLTDPEVDVTAVGAKYRERILDAMLHRERRALLVRSTEVLRQMPASDPALCSVGVMLADLVEGRGHLWDDEAIGRFVSSDVGPFRPDWADPDASSEAHLLTYLDWRTTRSLLDRFGRSAGPWRELSLYSDADFDVPVNGLAVAGSWWDPQQIQIARSLVQLHCHEFVDHAELALRALFSITAPMRAAVAFAGRPDSGRYAIPDEFTRLYDQRVRERAMAAHPAA